MINIVFQSIRKFNSSQLNNDAQSAAGDASPNNLQSNLDRLLDIYANCQTLLGDYDKKLLKVVEKHEYDFLNAYKTHMSKVERELLQLKAKAADQESRLANDERVLKLQKHLTWFRDEVDRLLKMKENHFNTIDMMSTKVQTMMAEKQFMEEQVKASKRQNKLLVMALTKQENNKANIEQNIVELHD